MTTYRDINREVLRLAVPSILANITIPLVGIVDVAIIGHISSAAAVGGIAVGTMLFDLLYWNFGFLRVGTSGMTAQAYGRGDVPEQAKLLTQSMTIAFGGALGIWLLQWFFVTLVLYLMPCSPEVADFARQYFFVRVWAAPATLALFALKGWFIGMQNTIAPMITDIVVNVVNMVASYALAVYTPLGAIGVAWGTLIAQYTGRATAAVILAIQYKHHLSLIQIRESMLWSEMKHFFVLNTNLFLRSLAFMVIYVGYTIFMSAYGDTELAVSAIIMKIFMF
ncbi:MAG: MATE family efflux transporter, partial [Paludibacteraceae bacterium]|nr:MATE family efflux transporter [Paludibacteraceae bacterium]